MGLGFGKASGTYPAKINPSNPREAYLPVIKNTPDFKLPDISTPSNFP